MATKAVVTAATPIMDDVNNAAEETSTLTSLLITAFSVACASAAGFTGAVGEDGVGPWTGDFVGEGVEPWTGDFVGEGVAVPGQSVSQDLIHSFSGSHHEYPADGIQPFSSRSLPGRMGISVGVPTPERMGISVGVPTPERIGISVGVPTPERMGMSVGASVGVETPDKIGIAVGASSSR